MPRLVGRVVALVAAVGLTAPVAGSAQSLRGTLTISPLSSDVSTSTAERPVLVRVPAERGPVYPFIDVDALYVVIEGPVGLIALGGECPEVPRLGDRVVLENRGNEEWELLVDGLEDEVAVEPGQRFEVGPPPLTDEEGDEEADEAEPVVEPQRDWPVVVSVAEAGGEWRCDFALNDRSGLRARPSRLSADRMAFELGDVVWPDDRKPEHVSLWVGWLGRHLCAGRPDGVCQFDVEVEDEGSDTVVHSPALDADTFYPDESGGT